MMGWNIFENDGMMERSLQLPIKGYRWKILKNDGMMEQCLL